MTLTYLANTVGPVYLYLALLGIGFALGWFAVQIKRELRVKYLRWRVYWGDPELRHAKPWWGEQ